MKKWLYNHPYLLTSAIFLAIILFGWRALYWRWENFAFIMLLYFIVTLGIRLDDISKKIGSGSKSDSSNASERENILGQLQDIKLSLRAINTTLNRVLERRAKENPPQDNPE
jgi:hypothetical protein